MVNSSDTLTTLLSLLTQLQASNSGKVTDWVKPGDTSGEFKRQVSSFRDWISRDANAKYPAEKGRYHLYVSYACPWACRTLIARKLKGLEDIISYSVVHWHLGEGGWRFVTKDEDVPGDNVVPDPIKGHENFTHLKDVYFESEKNYDGRYTVPVLYDMKTNRIVSNESSEILRMMGSEVSRFACISIDIRQLTRISLTTSWVRSTRLFDCTPKTCRSKLRRRMAGNTTVSTMACTSLVLQPQARLTSATL